MAVSDFFFADARKIWTLQTYFESEMFLCASPSLQDGRFFARGRGGRERVSDFLFTDARKIWSLLASDIFFSKMPTKIPYAFDHRPTVNSRKLILNLVVMPKATCPS